jgi:tripartite-type tricarboxylate transporter receptor subunit TctC
MTSTTTRLLAALAAALALGATPATAQTPVRMILPVGAGSGVDTIMRAAQGELSKTLGQPVVIENLPGAGGITGTSAPGQGGARRQHDRRACRTITPSTRACTRPCRTTA